MTAPKGRKFSHNYVNRGAPKQDSPRFRKRLFRAFDDIIPEGMAFASIIEGEVGADVPFTGYGWDWSGYFEQVELHDLLDTITVVFWALRDKQHGVRAAQWRQRVGRIIAEENLGYRVDDEGGVHLGVDDEFEHNRISTIRSMGLARYDAARASFEAAHQSLDGETPDTRAAIRHAFDALETVFKLLLGKKVSRLGSTEIERTLKPVALAQSEGPSRDALSLMLNAFSDWVNAGHQYRHAHGEETVELPPMPLAVLMVSTGASFLRWLVDLDQSQQQ